MGEKKVFKTTEERGIKYFMPSEIKSINNNIEYLKEKIKLKQIRCKSFIRRLEELERIINKNEYFCDICGDHRETCEHFEEI